MICPQCGAELYVGDWPLCDDGTGRNGHTPPRGNIFRPIDPSEAAVVYEHPVTGKIAYPGRGDTPMPERYQRRGYVRREFRTLRELNQFSDAHGLVNAAANFDRNGTDS